MTSVMVPFSVEIGDRERNSLAVLMRHDDHELAGLCGPRHQRMMDLQRVGDVGEILTGNDQSNLLLSDGHPTLGPREQRGSQQNGPKAASP